MVAQWSEILDLLSSTDASHVADKFTQLLLDALTRAAVEPAGLPLFSGKNEVGLFPNSAQAKPAAKKAIDEGLLRLVRSESRGKTSRDVYAATDAGLTFLLQAANPKQILEDFVRLLEQREQQVAELLLTLRAMAESLAGMRALAGKVLPQVCSTRISAEVEASRAEQRLVAESGSVSRTGERPMNGAMTLESPPRLAASVGDERDELAEAMLARLSDWSASAGAGQDCPLPELYRSLSCRESAPSIGMFHDCLRALHAAGQVYLHPWTGPLYALPEPSYALLVGHNIAYYASIRC